MPNVLFTQRCVRSCPYCFADKHMSESSPDDVLSWENLIYLADFLQAAGERRFSILGGEPTLHPQFNYMVAYLLERNFDVNVFTSGIMTDRMLDETVSMFAHLPMEKLTFVCNLNDPVKTHTPLAEQESVKRFLRAFGERVIPGFNIYRTDFDLTFLFQHISEYGLKKNIRIGLTHPIPGKKNIFIALEDIDAIIHRLFSFAPLFERLRIKPGLDCGFPLCRLSDDHLSWLYRYTGGKSDFGCGPVIDIGPDMAVWSCFPLSSFHKKSFFDFNTLHEMREYYQRLHDKVRVETGGIYEECDNCSFREENLCRGGCIAHSLSWFKQEAPVRQKEVYL
jgi:radical SAM protein with 4Fe4S-binding SPASM domain